MSESSEKFYAEIPTFSSRRDISRISNYRSLPPDWTIIVVDIRGSTKAIESGRYRDVNTVGASAIIAIKNALKDLDFPYVFGGDGATLMVPSARMTALTPVLLSVKRMAKDEFGFELRIGAVPVSKVLEAGKKVLVGRFAPSPAISLAVMAGSGYSLAESWVKDAQMAYEISESSEAAVEANYEGLECRWRPLPAQRGEYISVLAKANAEDVGEATRIYAEIIEEIELLYGAQIANQTAGAASDAVNPVGDGNLKVSLNPSKLAREWRVRTANKPWGERVAYAFRLALYALYGVAVFQFGLKSKSFDWQHYKKELISNSDFWKYDDTLRFVLDVNPVQKRALLALLELRQQRGEICYGTHSSSTAIMTCMVFAREGDHVHFIDGGDGGYAQAAKVLKKSLKKIA